MAATAPSAAAAKSSSLLPQKTPKPYPFCLHFSNSHHHHSLTHIKSSSSSSFSSPPLIPPPISPSRTDSFTFKSLSTSQPLYGLFLLSDSPTLAEIVVVEKALVATLTSAHGPSDIVVIEKHRHLEHDPFDISTAVPILRTLAATQTSAHSPSDIIVISSTTPPTSPLSSPSFAPSLQPKPPRTAPPTSSSSRAQPVRHLHRRPPPSRPRRNPNLYARPLRHHRSREASSSRVSPLRQLHCRPHPPRPRRNPNHCHHPLPESSAIWAKKALDLSPAGLMFPMVDSSVWMGLR